MYVAFPLLFDRKYAVYFGRHQEFIFGYEYDNREGILLEKVLHNLDMPIQSSSYELI